MRKIWLPLVISAGVAVAAASLLQVKKEYGKMKEMEAELESHPLYKAKKESVRVLNRADEKTVKIPENASLKSKLRACLDILK